MINALSSKQFLNIIGSGDLYEEETAKEKRRRRRKNKLQAASNKDPSLKKVQVVDSNLRTSSIKYRKP